jgi:hypothetical protein
MSDLLVIVPSRGRPGHVERLWEAWQATATGCAQLLIALDDDDPTAKDYPAPEVGLRYWIGPRNGFAPRLNIEAARYAGDYFALASWGDDHVPRTYGWDIAHLEALGALGTGFAYGNDGYQGEKIPTACAMTSNIVRALGWMTPPGLAHLYVDNVWRDLGTDLDRITYLPDVLIEHMHPSIGKAAWDPLTADANTPAKGAADKAAYERWCANDRAANVETLRALL